MPKSPVTASLDEICITAELARRPSRPPDYERESRALATLAQRMAETPEQLPQHLVDIALALCGAGSTGLSLLETGEQGPFFRWTAIAGVYASYVGGSAPRDHSPCGVCLDRGSAQLFSYPGRFFTYFQGDAPPIVESLVVPICVSGRPLGTLWIVSHDTERRFDAEDARLLTNLGNFAGSLHLITAREAAERNASLLARTNRDLETEIQKRTEELQRSHTALEEAHQQIRLVMDAAPVLISYVDSEQRFRFHNQAYVRWFGPEAERMAGKHVREVLGPAAYETVQPFVARVLSGETVTYERDMDYQHGDKRYVQTTLVPDLDSRGAVKGFVAVVNDLTERKRTEQALYDSETRYRTMIEQSPISVQVLSPEGKTLQVNHAWEELFGVTLDMISDYNILQDEQLAAKGIQPYIEKAFAGEAADIPAIQYEPDRGARVNNPHWVRACIYPVKEENGAVREIVLMHEDITEQHEAEQALHRQLNLTSTITQNVAEALFVLDPDGRTTFANPAAEEMFGWTQEELLGTVLHDRIHYKHADGTPHPMSECPLYRAMLAHQVVRQHEDAFVNRNGELVDVLCSHAPVLEHGKMTGAVLAVHDISARKRVEAQQRFLAESSAALASSLDCETTLSRVAGLAVPHLADWCVVHVVEADGTVRPLVIAHADPARRNWAEQLQTDYPYDPEAPHGVPRVLRTGQSEFYRFIPDELLVASARDEAHLRILRQVGFTSAMIVPMKARDKILGAITFVSAESRRPYTEADLSIAEDLALSAALAVDNSRLYQAERERSNQLAVAISEVHHRVKNNLQSVAALLEMQIPADEENVPVETVREGLNQIKTIALVHDLLARDQPIGKVNAGQVLTNLIALLSQGMRTAERPAPIRVQADAILLPTKAATALALIVQELVTNADKHSRRPKGEEATGKETIEVIFTREAAFAHLVVLDNGPGFPSGFDPALDANIGLELVTTLVRHDLRGTLAFSNRTAPEAGGEIQGARVDITFADSVLSD